VLPANKPLEWTGHHHVSASPPNILCLPLRGSVMQNPIFDLKG
jgi:hypothetical protein